MPAFAHSPLHRDNKEDIRKAINYRNRQMGFIGESNHIIMFNCLAKLGYWKDGITTLKAHKQQLEDQKKDESEAFAKERKAKLAVIEVQLDKLTAIKKALLQEEEAYNETLKVQKKLAIQDVEQTMLIDRKKKQQSLLDLADKAIKDMNVREMRLLAKQKNITNYSRKPKAELQELLEAAS